MRKIILIGLCAIIFNGCGLLPYKTEYTCPNAIGGSCGNALRSYNSALNDVYGTNKKSDIDETECIGCKGVQR